MKGFPHNWRHSSARFQILYRQIPKGCVSMVMDTDHLQTGNSADKHSLSCGCSQVERILNYSIIRKDINTMRTRDSCVCVSDVYWIVAGNPYSC